MMQPYPAYKRLHEMHERLRERGEAELTYLSGQYLSDLLVWYHLAWTGESVRRSNETIVRLMTQGAGFTYTDRTLLLELIGQLIRDLIPRYRKLAESGQIELSTTPHYHPLAPLLIDFSSARDSMPGVELPARTGLSGWKEPCCIPVTLGNTHSYATLWRTPSWCLASRRGDIDAVPGDCCRARLPMVRPAGKGFWSTACAGPTRLNHCPSGTIISIEDIASRAKRTVSSVFSGMRGFRT